jgi:hypothetical protein
MSSLAVADRAAHRRSVWRWLTDLCARRGSDVLLGVAMIAVATGFLAYLTGTFSVDTWLELVAGRDVWNLGIPHHETLTAASYGAVWHDQQWLSELLSFAVYRVGGLALMGILNVALLVGAIAGAVVAARRLGAKPLFVMLSLPICLWLLIPSREVRTQEFILPLFVGVLHLLTRDSRTRAASRNVYWCLPMLALWANLHGTVTLGVGLVGLRALTILFERRALLLRDRRQWRRPLILLFGAPLCMLVTPYGLGILSYYKTMFIESGVRHAVTEWQPITTEWIIAVPCFVLAGILIWSFGREQKRTRLFEQLALLALCAGSIEVIRNVLFFALAALVIMPLWLGGEGTADAGASAVDRVRPRLNAILAVVAACALVLAIGSTLTRPASAYELSYERTGVLTTIEKVVHTDPSIKVLADVRFADWLLWRDAALRGKVANDARFELLSSDQLAQMQAVFAVTGLNWKQGAKGYRLIVLDRKYDAPTVQAFTHEPGARVLYNDGEREVILRSAAEASTG